MRFEDLRAFYVCVSDAVTVGWRGEARSAAPARRVAAMRFADGVTGSWAAVCTAGGTLSSEGWGSIASAVCRVRCRSRGRGPLCGRVSRVVCAGASDRARRAGRAERRPRRGSRAARASRGARLALGARGRAWCHCALWLDGARRSALRSPERRARGDRGDAARHAVPAPPGLGGTGPSPHGLWVTATDTGHAPRARPARARGAGPRGRGPTKNYYTGLIETSKKHVLLFPFIIYIRPRSGPPIESWSRSGGRRSQGGGGI